MEKQNRTLSITLKSDLCTGSGYSYGGIINNDICYDDLGLPYIPAKRIKGCLREAAEIIGLSEEEIREIFGKSGSDSIRGVIIENAYLEHYDELYQELKRIPLELKKYVTPQSILEQFTIVRTQTKIGENGVAKDNSLRSFRSISHYSPVEYGQEMKFIANIDFVDLNKKDRDKFEQIVKSLRNMGLNRNRGLGSVKCKLDGEKDSNVLEEGINKSNISSEEGMDKSNVLSGKIMDHDNILSEERTDKKKLLTQSENNKQSVLLDVKQIEEEYDIYQFSYTIRNTAPLVFNTEHNYSTEKYISGQTMLGYFASAYLRAGNEAKEEFEELFLKNQVIFSNLYPCDEPEIEEEKVCNTRPTYSNQMKEMETVYNSEPFCINQMIKQEKNYNPQSPYINQIGKVYYPAPLYINQMKKTEKYVNITKVIPETQEACEEKNLGTGYASEHGNRPRRLHDKFVWTDGKNISVKEVETDIVYHHTKKSEKQNSSDGDLLYSFEAIRPQQFFTGSIIGKGKHIKKLAELLENNRIQLGKSKSSQYGNCILAGSAKAEKVNYDIKKYPRGCKILVTLQSDGIFLNEAGYTVNCNEVREAVRQALNIKEAKSNISDKLYSELQVRKLIGFYGKWNLKRQAIPVVCAGSTFEFLLGEDLVISEQDLYVGERIGEGYGKLNVIDNSSEDCRFIESEELSYRQKDIKLAREICKRVLLKEMKNKLLNQTLLEKVKMKNPTMVGKITFMLAESIQDSPDNRQEAYQNFCKKIDSIKDKEKKEQISGLKKRLICEGDELNVDELQYLTHIKDLVGIYYKFVDGRDIKIFQQNNEKTENSSQNVEKGDIASLSKGKANVYHQSVEITDIFSQNAEKINTSSQNETETEVPSQREEDKSKSLRNWDKVLGEELKQELKNLWSDYFLGVLTLAKYEQKETRGE